jgi:hypothetical protein
LIDLLSIEVEYVMQATTRTRVIAENLDGWPEWPEVWGCDTAGDAGGARRFQPGRWPGDTDSS